MTPLIATLIGTGIALLMAVGVIIFGLVGVLSGEEDLADRLKIYAALPDYTPKEDGGRRRTQFLRLRLRINSMLSGLASDDLSLQLMSANWPISVTEFMLIRIGGTLLGFVAGWLLFGTTISGAALAFMVYMLPGVFLSRGINRRRLNFEKQLVDVLVLVNGAVRAGFSLLQALEVVGKEMKAPASEEFNRVRREVALGLPLGKALENLSSRMQNNDLNLVVTAININYQVGGNLATMLEAVTETIRERIRLFSEVRVITTQQRYTSYLLTLLPFFIGAVIFLLNPDHMRRLFEPQLICIPMGALVGIFIGNLIIRRMVRIDV